MDRERYKPVIEGLLFVSGEEGITLEQLVRVLELDPDSVESLLNEMKEEFSKDHRGVQIIEEAGTYLMATKQEHALYYERLASTPTRATLSQAALETLAIIAYRQPTTRAEIEEIRGVQSERAIATLVSKSLIKVVGRKEGVGRALLYGTTKTFLQHFGLNDLSELPPIPEDIPGEQEQTLFSITNPMEDEHRDSDSSDARENGSIEP